MVSLETCIIAGIHYLIHPQKLGSITATINPDAILPVTLLTTDEIFSDRLEQILAEFDAIDDVFVPDFGSVLVEKVPENGTNSTTERVGISQELYHLETAEESLNDLTDLPSGPYILHGPNLYQAWRLYEDELEAFTFGVIPEEVNEPNQFRALNALSLSGLYKSIPVPSRLYHPQPSAKKPLSGVRFSISDVMSLKGVQTSLSSRSWTSLYSEVTFPTAQFARKLVDLGAVIVGKTKVSQFVSGREWVDIQAPWNPRADQYQSPSGSSAGAGAAIAGYEWLQHAVGEDAIGGLRNPGAKNGVYSIRSSFTNSSLEGVKISSPRFDTIGLSSRQMQNLEDVAKATLTNTGSFDSPKKLFYLREFVPDLPQEQTDLIDQFVEYVESFTGIKAEQGSLEDVWASNPPQGAKSQSLQEFMRDAPFGLFCYDYFREYEDFQSTYRDSVGREPFIEATPDFMWQLGREVSDEQRDQYLERIRLFQTWFTENFISPDENTAVIFPYTATKASYRQDGPGEPKAIQGVTSELLAPILGFPHLVIPFAQIAYESKVSKTTEQLPVSASILGPPGSDAALVRLVRQAFEAAKRRTSVDTGRAISPVDVNRSVVKGRQVEGHDPAAKDQLMEL